ncbi:MAG: hypothetical protein IPP71_06670 [Bacteroidetes bacterium]|nr:hypothetical protein [Bacteroidota bacterium]
MFGDNDWHLGDGAGNHTVPFKSNPWGMPLKVMELGFRMLFQDGIEILWLAWLE